MPTPEQLQSEIKTDPAKLGYADKTPHEILERMRVRDRVKLVEADMKEVFNFIVKTNVWDKLDAATTNMEAPEALRRKIRKFLVTISGPLDSLNFASSDIVNNLPLLQQFGVITGFEADVFLELGRVYIDRIEELWGEGAVVSVSDIAYILWPDELAWAVGRSDETRMLLQQYNGMVAQLESGNYVAIPVGL